MIALVLVQYVTDIMHGHTLTLHTHTPHTHTLHTLHTHTPHSHTLTLHTGIGGNDLVQDVGIAQARYVTNPYYD